MSVDPPASLSDILDRGSGPSTESGRGAASAPRETFGFDDPYAHVSLFGDRRRPTGQTVRNQVARCWQVQPGLPGVILRVWLDPAGALKDEPRIVGAETDAATVEAVREARRAIKACAPYLIPPGEAGTLTFDLRF